MQTVLVQINNNKAYRILEDLESLDIIKVLKKNQQQEIYLKNMQANCLPILLLNFRIM
jgi:ribosomal protein S25